MLLDVPPAEDVAITADWASTASVHGTGCTLSSAIVALRTRSFEWHGAVCAAERWLTSALEAADSHSASGRARPCASLPRLVRLT